VDGVISTGNQHDYHGGAQTHTDNGDVGKVGGFETSDKGIGQFVCNESAVQLSGPRSIIGRSIVEVMVAVMM